MKPSPQQGGRPADAKAAGAPSASTAPEQVAPNRRGTPPGPHPQQPQAAPRSGNGQDADGDRIFVSPLARRMAQQAGIDLRALKGSGPNGRIVKADIEAAQQRGVAAPAQAAASRQPPRRPLPQRRPRRSGAGPADANADHRAASRRAQQLHAQGHRAAADPGTPGHAVLLRHDGHRDRCPAEAARGAERQVAKGRANRVPPVGERPGHQGCCADPAPRAAVERDLSPTTPRCSTTTSISASRCRCPRG